MDARKWLQSAGLKLGTIPTIEHPFSACAENYALRRKHGKQGFHRNSAKGKCIWTASLEFVAAGIDCSILLNAFTTLRDAIRQETIPARRSR